MKHTFAKRLERLERQVGGDDLRVVVVSPGEPDPAPVPGEHLIVLRSVDMGEVQA